MTPREKLTNDLRRTGEIVQKSIEEMIRERKTPEYQEWIKRLQEKERLRNKHFAERGEDWRDIEIA